MLPGNFDTANWREVWDTLSLGPMISTHPLILYQAGLVLQGRGKPEAAEGAFREVLVRDPYHTDALGWLTVFTQNRQDFGEASEFRRRRIAVEIDLLGLEGGDREEAVAFKMSSEEDVPPPHRAPEAYVSAYFDSLADFYEDHLQSALKYEEPGLLFDAVQRIYGSDCKNLSVLDAGCGSGLAGTLFRRIAKRLEGIDLSLSLLALAQKRQIYDDLQLGEITRSVEERPNQYDLVIACFVLPWFGNLRPVMSSIACSLRPGGCFAFTIEHSEDPRYILHPTGRFKHHLTYVREEAAAAKLEKLSTMVAVLRHESQQPVHGRVVVLRKAV